ncbi:BEM46 PROTEIN [Pelomyxa schiedti]|nr:BEM46 PROTEIN [Pelomyxa schiedti]
MWNLIEYTAAGFVALALFVLVCLYMVQNHIVYVPQMGSTVLLDPARYGLAEKWREYFLKTRDGVRLQTWLFVQRKQAPTFIFFHSNAGNITHRLPHIAGFMSYAQVNVFIVSYRGYCKSTGSPSESGLKIDAETAYEFLSTADDLIDTSKIVVFGNSLGGAVAIYLASRPNVRISCLIIENTFTSVPDMVPVIMPFMRPFRNFSANKWYSIKDIAKVSVPILFLSSAADEMIPPSQMQSLYEAATSAPTKKLVSFPNGLHMNLCDRKEYYHAIQQYLQTIFT